MSENLHNAAGVCRTNIARGTGLKGKRGSESLARANGAVTQLTKRWFVFIELFDEAKVSG